MEKSSNIFCLDFSLELQKHAAQEVDAQFVQKWMEAIVSSSDYTINNLLRRACVDVDVITNGDGYHLHFNFNKDKILCLIELTQSLAKLPVQTEGKTT